MIELVSKIQTVSSDFSDRLLVELKDYRGVRLNVAGASLASMRRNYVDVFAHLTTGLN
jgi:hypothetical protein